jgi:hypothetical protein
MAAKGMLANVQQENIMDVHVIHDGIEPKEMIGCVLIC